MHEELARSLASARSLKEARERMLDAIARVVPHEMAMVHALSPRVPLETGVFRNIDTTALAASVPRWDSLAVELARIRDHALAHGGVAADHEALMPGSPAHALWDELVLRPQKLRTVVLVHFVVGDRVRGVM